MGWAVQQALPTSQRLSQQCPPGRRPYHTILTSSSGGYQAWQCRMMYHHYQLQRSRDPCGEMGGLTRVLPLCKNLVYLNLKGAHNKYTADAAASLAAVLRDEQHLPRLKMIGAGCNAKEKDDQGRPTRKALALKAWGFGSVEAARNFANRHKKA